MTSLLLALVLAQPAAEPTWDRAIVTVYAPKYHNRKTASGEVYNHDKGLTAAVKRVRSGKRYRPVIPFGTVLELEHGGRVVRVRVNDHGAYNPSGHWIDLSGEAWAKLTNGAKPTRLNNVKWRVVK